MRCSGRALALVIAAVGCGGSSPSTLTAQSTGGTTPPRTNPIGGTAPGATTAGGGTPTTGTAFLITISNLSFSPLNLAVPPGATVAVMNEDGMPHSVTSEATPGAFTPGAPGGLAPFDTGEFSSGQKTFTVPANAAAGTVMPYYCRYHRQAMNTPTGTITIDPNAKPATASGPVTAPTTSMPAPTTPTTTTTGTSPPMPSMPGFGGY